MSDDQKLNASSQIDTNLVLKHFAGDEDLMKEIIRDFLRSLPIAVEKIEGSIRTEDAKMLRSSAHTLNGSSANFFMKDLQTSLFCLEELAKKEKFTQAEANAEFIKTKSLLVDLENSLKNFLAGEKAA